MKDAFQVLDFDDPSSEQLKAFMLQCFITTVILKSEQVRVYVCTLKCYLLQFMIILYQLVLGTEIFEFIVLLVYLVYCVHP